MPTTILGYSGVTQEVEGSRAARAVLRPDDPGPNGGWYKINPMSLTMVAGLAQNVPIGSTIFSWRVGANANNLVNSIRRVRMSIGNATAAFTAGSLYFVLNRVTGFTQSDGGGQPSFPGSGNKLKTTFPNSFMTAANGCDIRIATTGALSVGTRVLDAQPLGVFCTSTPNTLGWSISPGKVDLLELRGWEHPLILGPNEGMIINAMVPATGTWIFEVDVLWAELPAGQY
jgi:hypothetical protein